MGALNRQGLYAEYTNTDADLYFPGGDSQDPLTCVNGLGARQDCMGTSFSAALGAGWAAAVYGGRGLGWFEVPRAKYEGYHRWNNDTNSTVVLQVPGLVVRQVPDRLVPEMVRLVVLLHWDAGRI